MIKLIALDLDGTLLDSQKNISEMNKQAIHKALAKGVKVVLCTGRPLGGIKRYVDELDLLGEEDFSITYNGGLVQRNHDSKVLSEKTLSYQDIQTIYQLSQDLGLPMNMLDLEYVYEPEYPTGRDSLYPSLMSASLPFVKREIASFEADHQFNKVVFCTDPAYLDDAITRIPAAFHEQFSTMKSRPLLYEIMHPEVDKGSGIARLCELMGFSADEVMVCGDEENDAAMFDYAGVAVAMENATEAIKSKATYITKTNDEDGVAHAIHKFVL
ncbi:sugar-phosphatase [Jeotgalibaca porci]|uniref:Sugar-phosphatase n=1 Tax=Jeotgalibaca porci TaxID=1868793 RepID=A0A6G7WFI4_9LACT|nr:sugar-phosphatase [Jeotgalibaca porci]QIK50938.1 sugar-phosphatase [Jeotgalibaca porci]